MNYKGHISTSILYFPGLVFTTFLVEKELDYNFISNNFNSSNLELSALSIVAYLIGQEIPDKDLIIKKFREIPQYTYHRQLTHSLLLWISLLVLSFYLESVLLLFLTLGVFSHLISDFLTGSIPIFLYGHYKKGFRIGITNLTFNLFNDFWTKSIPKFFDKHYKKTLILGLIGNLYFFLNFF